MAARSRRDTPCTVCSPPPGARRGVCARMRFRGEVFCICLPTVPPPGGNQRARRARPPWPSEGVVFAPVGVAGGPAAHLGPPAA